MMMLSATFFAALVSFAFFPSTAAADQGPIVVGQTFLASSMDPRSGSTGWALTSHGIAEKLFTVDRDGEIVGQIADSVSRINEEGTIWEVQLKLGYTFSDGTPVGAQHVVNCLNELNQQNPNAQASLGAISVTVVDQLRVRIESERPTHVMDAVLAEWVFVIYYMHDQGKFIYTGPYVVSHFDDGDSPHMDLAPNQHYPDAELRPDIELRKFPDGHALAEAMKSLSLDVGFHLPIDTLPELRAIDGVNVRSFEVGYHYMMFHNSREAHMADARVRQAIDLALDRTALSQALAGGVPTRSLFPDNSPYFSDDSDPHADQDEAEALLEEAGWVLTDDGKRFKDGKELIVDLVAYPHRPGLVIMQPIIEKQLISVGITVHSKLTGDDWTETQTIIDNGDFDLLLWAQHTLPAGDPAWFLNAFFRSDGSNNHAGLQSATVDLELDTLSIMEDHASRVRQTAQTQAAILADVPVSNLVTPIWHVGLSDRAIDVYEPYGSDYYVIRGDTFLGLGRGGDEEPGSGANAVHAAYSSLVSIAVAGSVVALDLF